MAKKRATTVNNELNREATDENDVGIDPHKKTLTASVLDRWGGTVATETFKVSGVGHRALEDWATSFGPVRRWGIEGASSLGRHTAVFLIERGHDVRDVCPTRTAEQSRRRRQGRTDGDGQPVRHRLNRGGNRRVNAVLHRMAVTQLRCDERAQAIFNDAASAVTPRRPCESSSASSPTSSTGG